MISSSLRHIKLSPHDLKSILRRNHFLICWLHSYRNPVHPDSITFSSINVSNVDVGIFAGIINSFISISSGSFNTVKCFSDTMSFWLISMDFMLLVSLKINIPNLMFAAKCRVLFTHVWAVTTNFFVINEPAHFVSILNILNLPMTFSTFASIMAMCGNSFSIATPLSTGFVLQNSSPFPLIRAKASKSIQKYNLILQLLRTNLLLFSKSLCCTPRKLYNDTHV